MKTSLSTSELARLWGLSESTIKRWADSGALGCRKTVGGHRRFAKEDVLDFQRAMGLALASSIGESPELAAGDQLRELFAALEYEELSKRFMEAALAARHAETLAILRGVYDTTDSLAIVGEEIIRPAMWTIGELWRAGHVSVLDEHLATLTATAALEGLGDSVSKRPGTGLTALVGCVEGEFHQMAAILIREVLVGEGWSVVFLGQHTSLLSFADAVKRFSARLVCISATMDSDLERMAVDFAKLRRAAADRDCAIVPGGQALRDEHVRGRLKGAVHAASLYDLLEIVDQIVA